MLITLYTLVVLRDLGLDPARIQACKMIDHVDIRLVFQRTECTLARQLLGEQFDDGVWNREATPSRRSSFHTTICLLERILEDERAELN